jgi:hypothetical protein
MGAELHARHAREEAKKAAREADRAEGRAWSLRMEGYGGPAQDEVIVLRKAKRLGSNVRSEFSTAAGRRNARASYVSFLDTNPLRVECFERFVWHLAECFPEKEEDAEDVVLGRGYF